jgi:hypothetical protein
VSGPRGRRRRIVRVIVAVAAVLAVGGATAAATGFGFGIGGRGGDRGSGAGGGVPSATARFVALLNGSQSRDEVDRWAAQWVTDLDAGGVGDEQVWWALTAGGRDDYLRQTEAWLAADGCAPRAEAKGGFSAACVWGLPGWAVRNNMGVGGPAVDDFACWSASRSMTLACWVGLGVVGSVR